MTNEKTIEILKELWRYEKTDKYSESEIREAIKNAIKAVEAVDYDCVDCKWYLEVKKNEMHTEDRQVTDGDLISRQSVIIMLNKIENAVEDGDGFQFNEWIDYAKDIPCAEKTNGDLISRVKDIIRNDSNLSEAQVIDLLRRIDELPSAENTAEWIDLGNVIQCSNCETLYPKVRVDLKHYCERCGSRMKGVE